MKTRQLRNSVVFSIYFGEVTKFQRYDACSRDIGAEGICMGIIETKPVNTMADRLCELFNPPQIRDVLFQGLSTAL